MILGSPKLDAEKENQSSSKVLSGPRKAEARDPINPLRRIGLSCGE